MQSDFIGFQHNLKSSWTDSLQRYIKEIAVSILPQFSTKPFDPGSSCCTRWLMKQWRLRRFSLLIYLLPKVPKQCRFCSFPTFSSYAFLQTLSHQFWMDITFLRTSLLCYLRGMRGCFTQWIFWHVFCTFMHARGFLRALLLSVWTLMDPIALHETAMIHFRLIHRFVVSSLTFGSYMGIFVMLRSWYCAFQQLN